jgi:hypothetical protein
MSKSRKIGLLSTAAIALQLLAPSQVLASSLENHIRVLEKTHVDTHLKSRIKQVIESNAQSGTRPAFCPLNNTKSYQKAADSLKSIVTVFKDDCFDKNQSVVDQILTSSKELEEELNKLAEETGKDTTDVVPTIDEIEVDGIPLQTLMDGMNTLFNKSKCSNLDETPLLERSADVIQTFSQFGLYSPSGVSVAYGGLAVASMMRFINSIFEKRFEFENEADIETFVKLNCAYYDVRNQVRSLEMFDIDTNKHYKDKEIVADILAELTKSKKALVLAKKDSVIEISKLRVSHLSEVEKDLEKIIKPLHEKIKEPISDKPGKSAKYQQAEVLGELAFNLNLLTASLDEYIKESTGADRFLNILFKNKLEELNNAEELMNMKISDFNKKFLADLASSFNRVLESIEKKRGKAGAEFDKGDIIDVDGEGYSIAEINKLLKSKELAKREKDLDKAIKDMTTLKNRIDAVISKKEYSSEDSKDGGLREVIKGLDTVKNHVYGKYGKQFIEKMRDLSRTQNKNFKAKYKRFSENYLDNGQIRPVDTLNEDQVLNACIDAQTGREIWVYSQKLSELGYDFLSTNNDIFGDPGTSKDRKKLKQHTDSAVLARRIISARNYQKKVNNYIELGKTEVEIEGKKLTIAEAAEAVQYVEFYGKKYTVKEALELLEDKFGQKGLRKQRIGSTMIDIISNRDRTVQLQKLYKDYKCDTAGTFTR